MAGFILSQSIMKTNALAVANYFIDIPDSKLTPLKLMKLVYIAHGFSLAMLDKPMIDYRFDKVEAWKYGPVIPSVYWSFKQYGNGIIKEKTKMWADEDGEEQTTPMLQDEYEKAVCDFVWHMYGNMTGSELVTLLHNNGTPWYDVYIPSSNVEIPESMIKAYYKKLVDVFNKKANINGR